MRKGSGMDSTMPETPDTPYLEGVRDALEFFDAAVTIRKIQQRSAERARQDREYTRGFAETSLDKTKEELLKDL